MNAQEALVLINKLQPNPMLPPAKRNKSWLFIYGEASGQLHFYDVKSRPAEAFERLNKSATDNGRAVELLDVLAYNNPDEASAEARNFKAAQDNISYYRALALTIKPALRGAPPRASSTTDNLSIQSPST